MSSTQTIGTLQKTVETLCEIINMQSKVIDNLFLALARYATQEELENVAGIEEIKEVAEMKKEAGL